MVFGSGKKLEFRNYVQGTWGSFDAPAGRVNYIMTKAKLGEETNDPERQLTKSLAPVREVMEADSLDFSQLLQRDLDDHRVAIDLVPYLLRKKPTGPAFLPPIMAVLLPFRHKKPTVFPQIVSLDGCLEESDGTTWQEERSGETFKVQRLWNPETKERHSASWGKLWWNDSESRLVVLDGQHRAMALLAIERTTSNGWSDSSGARYRSFYEAQVESELKRTGQTLLDLSRIEVPVTVCWFPEETGGQGRPHEAARKLFVDVNKEAKPPSESRIVLLSDAELINILTRRMLSELRSSQSGELLPLFAVEYDNPTVNSSRSARWSVVTNIHLLKDAVDWCIFGPADVIKNVDSKKAAGRPNNVARDGFMRLQLGVSSLFADQIIDGDYAYQREKLGNTEFPLGQVDMISNRFAETWAVAILTLLSNVRPYAAHVEALKKVKADWHTDETSLTLGFDALFGGVGVYWTLKDSNEHYQSKRPPGKAVKPEEKSDVIRAWEALQAREVQFDARRTNEYMKSSSDQSKSAAKAAYLVFNTQACQLGLVLTLASIWEIRKNRAESPLDGLPALALGIVSGLNAYFTREQGKAADGRLVFNKDVTYPLNQIQTMDTQQAVYFRYFWLELLSTDEAWTHIVEWFPDQATFNGLRDRARKFYLDLCINQNQRSFAAAADPGTPESEIRAKARDSAVKSLAKALEKWCGVEKESFASWLASIGTEASDVSPKGTSVTEDGNDPENEKEEAAEPEVTRLEDLINDDDI